MFYTYVQYIGWILLEEDTELMSAGKKLEEWHCRGPALPFLQIISPLLKDKRPST